MNELNLLQVLIVLLDHRALCLAQQVTTPTRLEWLLALTVQPGIIVSWALLFLNLAQWDTGVQSTQNCLMPILVPLVNTTTTLGKIRQLTVLPAHLGKFV